MVFVYFVLAAAVTVFAAIKLSQYADVISDKTSIGGMMVGTLLLAGATSLPEISTSVSAAAIGNADIAVGNMIGSNLFNLFILALFDVLLRRRRILETASRDHLNTALLGLLLTGLVIAALGLRMDISVLGIGLDALIIGFAYVLAMVAIHKLPKSPPSVNVEIPDSLPRNPTAELTVKTALVHFVIAATIILAAGTALSVLGDQIAIITGIGSSFIGSFLIAATTSLPEAISVFVALRLRNVNMAVGAILGSNVFNMIILALSDPVYRAGPILSGVSGSHMIIAVGVFFMTQLALFSLIQKKTMSTLTYILPSLAIIFIYFLASYLNFTY